MKFIKLNNVLIKKINHIALPLILNSVTGMMIELCDQAMMGRVSLAAFGSVGLISSTVNSITGVIGMTCIAFNIMGSRLKGEGNNAELKNHFMIHLLLDIIAGAVFFIVSLVFGKAVLTHFYNLQGETLVLAVDYLNIFSLSLGINMILFSFSSYFKIAGKTKYILYANIASSVSNVILDYILIFGKLGFAKMGARGNAIGSVLALILGCIIYFFAIRNEEPLKIKCRINFKVLGNIIKVSIPLMGQEVLESTVFVIAINAILSRIGMVEVSAYNLLLSIIGIALMPMYSYSQTSLTLISENIGAGVRSNIKKIPGYCIGLAVGFYGVISTVMLIFRRSIIIFITNNNILINAAISYFLIAIAISIFYIPATVYKYSLQGMEDEKWVFISSSIVNLAGIAVILFLTRILNIKLYGVYIGLGINYLGLFYTFYLRYHIKTYKVF